MKKVILTMTIASSILLQSCGGNESTKNETPVGTTNVDTVSVDSVATQTVDTVKTQ